VRLRRDCHRGYDLLKEDPQRELRRATAPEHVPGLPEVCPRGSELVRFRLAVTQLTKLLLSPPEDIVVRIRDDRTL